MDDEQHEPLVPVGVGNAAAQQRFIQRHRGFLEEYPKLAELCNKIFDRTLEAPEFLTRLGANGIQLAENWRKLSVLSHPTKYASENSAVVIVSRVAGRQQIAAFAHKKADYLASISRLIMAVTYDLPGWISLGCDENRMPHVEDFRAQAEQIAAPILNAPVNHGLPETSIRTAKKKNAP